MRTIQGMAQDINNQNLPLGGRKQVAPAPFRRAVLRGLAVLCPPLLTILVIVWTINTTRSYFLEPVTHWTREGIVWCVADIRQDLGKAATVDIRGETFHRLENGEFIPESVYELVQHQPGKPLPVTGNDYYCRYVDLTYLRPYLAVPFFLAVFTLLLYFLGKFMAAGIGRLFVAMIDRSVSRVPVVRSVYSSIKQVSDFLFSEHELKFTRVVAVEYPNKGIWTMGFVTNENFKEVEEVTGEPVLVVLLPYSPIPHTGCTIVVRRSACIDLNVTFDQACQFIISCGVVVPHHRLPQMNVEENKKIEESK
jgi:uncharacterized membrane protein